MENVGWQIVEWVTPIALALLTWLLSIVARWLMGKTRNEALKALLLRLEDAAALAVQEVEQTFVGDLRKARIDGKLLEDEKQQALTAALTATKRMLGNTGNDEIVRLFGLTPEQVDGFLTSRIEAVLHSLRNR